MEITTDKKRTDKKNLIILFSPWDVPIFIFNEIKRKIPKTFGYIHYHYTHDILNPDPYLTKKYCLNLMKKVIFDLKELNKIKKREFYFYAQSLGGIFAAYALNKINVEKGYFIVPGDNLAECFWEGMDTQKIKKEMQKNGTTLKKLKEIWKEISPDTQFKGKARNVKYFIKLSVNDVVIPYKNGLRLMNIFKKKGFEFELHEGVLPHKKMCLYEALFPKKALDFLTKKD